MRGDEKKTRKNWFSKSFGIVLTVIVVIALACWAQWLFFTVRRWLFF